MSTIFVSHAQENADCAENIHLGLEAKGYTSWREPGYPGPTEASYPHMIENAILGSAAVVLVWSGAAEHAAWVARHIQFAQRLKKFILPVVLDGTALPNTLIVDSVITCQTPCDDAVAQLLPHLSLLDNIGPLITLSEQAANDLIGKRKEAIDQAAGMLQRNEHREAVQAMLEYLAKHDLMMGVRDKAQEALEADAKRAAPPPPFLHLGDPRHIIGVQCEQCKHVTYFDRRRICAPQGQVIRETEEEGDKAGWDRMELPCERCGHKIPTHVDCREYRGGSR